jgi:hypothetical protein
MCKINSARIQEHFENLTDPRRREVRYPLINIVVIAVCAVICGADDFVAITYFVTTETNRRDKWDSQRLQGNGWGRTR